MLRKKEVYTIITPIPGFIPRRLALDILQSHSEVITLNPLVLSHKAIPAPRDAPADEYHSTWYEITERVQVIPGTGKVGSKQICFNGCFHNMPWGLQTHIYAPFGIDMRIKYRVGGNQPGIEPPEARELGMAAAPKDGLYLREDIEFKCNISLVSFVKATLTAASKDMVQRFIQKAELLDAGVLQAMMTADGHLKTINPNDRSQMNPMIESPQLKSATTTSSPHTQYSQPYQPQRSPYESSEFSPKYPTGPGDYNQFHQQKYGQHNPYSPRQEQFSPQPMELPASTPPPMELPGDAPGQYR